MPLVFLERFPWPSLQTYTALSAVLLAGTLLNAYTAVTETATPAAEETQTNPVDNISDGNVATDILPYLISDSLFVWVGASTHFFSNYSFAFFYMSRRISNDK